MNPRLAKRMAIVLALALAVALFFILDLGQYLSLSYIKSTQAQFQDIYTRHTFLVLGAYFLIYVAVVMLNLPGAAVMTLAGGALFGFWTALIVVSFASTIGATLACGLSRYLFRDFVQNRFGHRLSAINAGVEREGAFYLFTMRLIPAIPFFVINLVMGLTSMRLVTFYWVSQVGMLPGTAVFVNAGKELGQLESLSGIMSPSLIISFVLLGVFPLVVKKLVALYRKRAGLTSVDASESLPEEASAGQPSEPDA